MIESNAAAAMRFRLCFMWDSFKGWILPVPPCDVRPHSEMGCCIFRTCHLFAGYSERGTSAFSLCREPEGEASRTERRGRGFMPNTGRKRGKFTRYRGAVFGLSRRSHGTLEHPLHARRA